VQRIIGRLVKLGLLRRIERKRTGDRNDSNMYDFGPLIERLKRLAVAANPERKVEERPRYASQPGRYSNEAPDRPPRPPIEKI
jgi:hypothetical protein